MIQTNQREPESSEITASVKVKRGRGLRVAIRFTSVPQDVRTYLEAAELRYEYQVINRSLHV